MDPLEQAGIDELLRVAGAFLVHHSADDWAEARVALVPLLRGTLEPLNSKPIPLHCMPLPAIERGQA